MEQNLIKEKRRNKIDRLLNNQKFIHIYIYYSIYIAYSTVFLYHLSYRFRVVYIGRLVINPNFNGTFASIIP